MKTYENPVVEVVTLMAEEIANLDSKSTINNPDDV